MHRTVPQARLPGEGLRPIVMPGEGLASMCGHRVIAAAG